MKDATLALLASLRTHRELVLELIVRTCWASGRMDGQQINVVSALAARIGEKDAIAKKLVTRPAGNVNLRALPAELRATTFALCSLIGAVAVQRRSPGQRGAIDIFLERLRSVLKLDESTNIGVQKIAREAALQPTPDGRVMALLDAMAEGGTPRRRTSHPSMPAASGLESPSGVRRRRPSSAGAGRPGDPLEAMLRAAAQSRRRRGG